MNCAKRQLYLFFAVIALLFLVAASLVGPTEVVASTTAVVPSLTDVPILNYHKIDTLQHPLSIPPEEFEKQMAFLAEEGYHSITPDQLTAYLNSGVALPEKPILITFDDGYADNYVNAFPIMQKYGMTGTIFIITNYIGKDPRFLNWDQIRQMQQAGFVFGSHTANHQSLTTVPPEQAMEELRQSAQKMKLELGKAPRYIAYPTGTYNLPIETMVKQAGYKAAFTIRYGQVGSGSDPYALERIPIFASGPRTFRSFYIRLTGAPILERLGAIRN